MHGLSCGMWDSSISVVACRIKFPDQGANPGPLLWQHRVSATGPPGKSLKLLLYYLIRQKPSFAHER